jgi:hypothetical protein
MTSFPCIRFVDENYFPDIENYSSEDCDPEEHQEYNTEDYSISKDLTSFLEPKRVIAWLAIPIERRAAIQELAEFLCEDPDELLTAFQSITI